MSEVKETNAFITSAELSTSDNGLLALRIGLDYGESEQSFESLDLYRPNGVAHHRIYGPAGHFIYRVMEVAGVEEWSKLVGKPVRVRYTSNKVEAIGHFIKNDWFCPEQDFS